MQTQLQPITVLMPAYNAGQYIREAIESVLNQTFRDFELVIINDGSNDDTEAIVSSYKDERIRLHNQENQGVIGALNAGLKLAHSKYIARFDADDICYPDRLQVQYDFMEAHPDYVLLGSASDYIDKDGNFLFEWQPVAYDTDAIKEDILSNCPLDHPTVMYKRDLAMELGGYPAGAIHFEDHLFWTAFLKKGKVCNLQKPLIKHRFNPESVTIDEKWRGQEFSDIKYKSIRQGFVSDSDAQKLRSLVVTQDVKKYKTAAYYSMIGKKYLWNQYNPGKARKNLLEAIKILPFKTEPYLLFALSFLPKNTIAAIYNKRKGR